MKKRIVSILLAIIMLLGMIPTGMFELPVTVAAQPTASRTEEITIDFRQLAEEVSEQSWWQDLEMGSQSTKVDPTEEGNAQYLALLDYLQDNKNWTINETESGVTTKDHAKMIILNTDETRDWGLRYYSAWLGDTEELLPRNDLQIDLTVEQAGRYKLVLDAFLENQNSTQATDTVLGGSGYILIRVNGETALAKQCLKGNNEVKTVYGGYVELHEGVNTVSIHNVKDMFGNNGHDRRSVCLNSLSFVRDGSIQVDFKQFAQKASQQSWWSDLRDSDVEGIKMVGDDYMSAPTEAEYAAFQSMQAYLEEEGIWNISEGFPLFNDPYNGREIYFNTTDDDYGLRFYPGILNASDDRDRLLLTVQAPEAGLYHFELSVLNEASNPTVAQVNGTMGRAWGNVYVNDEPVLEEYCFRADADKAVSLSLGAVELKEGTNTVTFEVLRDESGAMSTARRAINLRSMDFIPLNGVSVEQGRTMTLDLRATYLPLDASVSPLTHQVTSDNTDLVKAEITAEGLVKITGYALGSTQLTVTSGESTICVISVEVVEATTPDDGVQYTLDGFQAEILSYGTVAKGEVVYYVNGEAMSEEELCQTGALYYTTGDPNIATVDLTTGDVTPVGEGITAITAYALLDGVVTSDSVLVTVTDDTDLASIDLYASVDYVGVGNTTKLHLIGKKASGAYADMTEIAVAYSVDKTGLAAVSEDGRLTGIQAGDVIVTAAVGVEGVEVSDTLELQIVENGKLAGEDVLLDFTDGRVLDLREATVEENGVALVLDQCYDGGQQIQYTSKTGIVQQTEVGGKLVLDFVVKKSGWYWLEARGGLYLAGSVNNIIVDDAFVTQIDFGAGNGAPYSAYAAGNTIWLDAGIHRVQLQAVTEGTSYLGMLNFYATADPNAVTVSASAQESELLVGQTTQAVVTLQGANGRAQQLLNVSAAPEFTNYYTMSSSDTNVVSVSGNTLTAKAAGTATITVKGKWQDSTLEKTFTVTVCAGTIASVELNGETTTLKPNGGSTQLTFVAYGTDGAAVSHGAVSYVSDHTAVANVSNTGLVTVGSTEGSAKITASVTEDGRTIEASCWITVTQGKTEPTIYTYEERAAAQENAETYDWAIDMKEAAVKKADYYVEHLEEIYNMWIREGIPRTTRVGMLYTGNAYRYCRYCGEDIVAEYGVYPWIVDPIENPWKVTCPACKRDFPSNDFESYYKSGLDEQGYFHKENADPQYLVNELYPEKGEGWGVDDGTGYNSHVIPEDGTKEDVHTYIAYYLHCVFCSIGSSKHAMHTILDSLRDAYLYTGDEIYGKVGAILIDRVADIYPEYDRSTFSTGYANSDGNSAFGRMVGCIWEAETLGVSMATAADAFWPCMESDEVVLYLRDKAAFKGVEAETITPESIRENVDNGILLEIYRACRETDMSGNFGMQQSALAYAAIALDRQPKTDEMIDWVFRYGEREIVNGQAHSDGGAVMYHIVDLVDRDGFGNEVSYLYNHLWCLNLIDLADALEDYEGTDGMNLWQNPKFVNMFSAMCRATVCGRLMPQAGEAGFVQSTHNYTSPATLTTAFANTGNREIARALYAANGNTVKGLHADIFTRDPESGIQNAVAKIVEEDGIWSWSESNMMSGFGIGILREGPDEYVKNENENEFFDYWMYFGKTGGGGHAQLEALNIDLEAFGLGMSSSMGYPLVVSAADPERMQWVRNTVSHNTVVVNDKGQSEMVYGGFPLHFEDAGEVKIVDADASNAYPETDIYRRTLVTVAAENGVHYAVDFFRVLGGSEHVYSFHGATTIAPETTGLSLVQQPMGTYAGPGIPYGPMWVTEHEDPSLNMGSGYSWLDNVSRDSDPETVFTVDFAIEDIQDHVPNSEGIGMKFTMLSEEPMTEVAIADGHPPASTRNPESVKYLLVRRSGEDGMDTLFTSIIEPYQTNELIASSELVDVVLTEGPEGATDKAAAIKVTLVGGRVDYIVYATNPDCTYEVDGKFIFQGFTGVCSYKNDVLIYSYGCEATTVATAVTDAQSKVTGTVTGFTEGIAENYTMTVSMDEAVEASELTGRYIFVDNDGERNAAYRIYGATVSGTTATLDLHTQTLVRGYEDKENMELGYCYNIAAGQNYTIPLSTEYSCPHTRNRVSYSTNSDGTHTVTRTCTTCGQISSSNVANCKDGTDADTLCDRCGYDTAKTVEKFSIAGSNMNLGNALEVNFLFLKKNVTTTGLTAVVTQQKADGTTKVTETAQEDWTVNGNYYLIATGVAAKEMADPLTIEIVDADGNVYNNDYSTSVREYAGKALTSSSTSDYMKILVVDMLNYGAAAQINFEYNTEDLANKNLTEEQRALATDEVECTNYQVKGTNCYGSNLNLADRIEMNVYFSGMKNKNIATMYAIVSFTSWLGEEKNITVPGSEFIALSSSIYGVVVDDIVLADAKQLVTVTMYNADGTVHGTGSDSVESYANRGSATAAAPLYANIMKFATSAYNYLSNR